MAASNPMMARTQTTSMRVKPPSPTRRLAGPADNIGRRSGPAFLTIGAIRHDIIGTVLSWRTVNIRLAPRVVRHNAALQVWTVPRLNRSGGLHQRVQPFPAVRITTGIEIEQIERASKALNLDLCGLDLRLSEVVQNARADQAHDHRDNRDDDQNFDQREAALAAPTPAEFFPIDKHRHRLLFNDLGDRQQRGHHRHDQSTDDRADYNDRGRTRDTDDAVEAALQLGLVEIGDVAG